MNLALCSDVHDDIEAFTVFTDHAVTMDCDQILMLGDLLLRPYTRESLERLVATEDAEQFLAEKSAYSQRLLREFKTALEVTGIEYLVIPGNYDSQKDFQEVFGEKNLHEKTAQIGEAKVVGHGGSYMTPQHIELLSILGDNVEFDHAGVYQLLNQENADILMMHTPPVGLCDTTHDGGAWGAPVIRLYVEQAAPKLVLCGHVHESGPLANNPTHCAGLQLHDGEKGKTFVINPGNLGRFEIVDPKTLEAKMQLPYGTFQILDLREDGTPVILTAYSLEEKNRKVGEVKQIYSIEF